MPQSAGERIERLSDFTNSFRKFRFRTPKKLFAQLIECGQTPEGDVISYDWLAADIQIQCTPRIITGFDSSVFNEEKKRSED